MKKLPCLICIVFATFFFNIQTSAQAPMSSAERDILRRETAAMVREQMDYDKQRLDLQRQQNMLLEDTQRRRRQVEIDSMLGEVSSSLSAALKGFGEASSSLSAALKGKTTEQQADVEKDGEFRKFGITVETILNLSPTTAPKLPPEAQANLEQIESFKAQLPDGNKFQVMVTYYRFKGQSPSVESTSEAKTLAIKALKGISGVETNDSVVTIGNNKGVLSKISCSANGVIYAFNSLIIARRNEMWQIQVNGENTTRFQSVSASVLESFKFTE